MKNIILIGPPGAGKGTQAKKLAKKFNIKIFATGDILRSEVEQKTEIGQKVEQILAAGKLVGDKLINQIVLEKLDKHGQNFILDGFPRNKKQAKALIKFLNKKNWPLIIFELKLDDEIAIERISGRRTCSCGQVYHIKYNPPKKEGICDVCGKELKIRSDEKPEVVKDRLEIYHQDTEPLIEFLLKQKKVQVKYFSIDSSKSIEEIHQDILLKL